MNDSDIQDLLNAFSDFMKHAESEIDYFEKQCEAKNYAQHFYEQKASELGVSVEYYLQEFV